MISGGSLTSVMYTVIAFLNILLGIPESCALIMNVMTEAVS